MIASEMKRQVHYQGIDGMPNAGQIFLSAGAGSTPATIIIPPTFQKQSGITPEKYDHASRLTGPIIGTEIFRRYMSAKVKFIFPYTRQGLATGQDPHPESDGAIHEPTELFVIWGWHEPLNLNEHTTPNGETIRWTDGGTADDNLTTELIKRIGPHYDSPHEFMKYQTSTSKSYVVEGVKKIRPDRLNQIPVPQQTMNVATGLLNAPPTWQGSLKWKMGMNRPVKHVHSGGSNAGWYPSHTGFWYPGPGEPIPFICIYNPQCEKQGVAALTSVPGRPSVGKIRVELAFAEWFQDA